MADGLSGAQAGQCTATRQTVTLDDAKQKPAGVQIACTGGVNHSADACRRNINHGIAGQDHRAALAARDHRDGAMFGEPRAYFIQVGGAQQRGDFHLVGKKDVHTHLHQRQEIVPVPRHAEGVGQRQRNPTFGRMRQFNGAAKSRFGMLGIKQVTLQIGDCRATDDGCIHVRRGQQNRCAEKRRHGALRVGRDHHQAAGAGRTFSAQGAGCECHAQRVHVLPEHVSHWVFAYLAYEGAATPQGTNAGDGVGRRAARGLPP